MEERGETANAIGRVGVSRELERGIEIEIKVGSGRVGGVSPRARASGRSVRVSPREYACRHRVNSRFGWVRCVVLIGGGGERANAKRVGWID